MLKFASENQPRLPSLEALKWRVDVGISTRSVTRPQSRSLDPQTAGLQSLWLASWLKLWLRTMVADGG